MHGHCHLTSNKEDNNRFSDVYRVSQPVRFINYVLLDLKRQSHSLLNEGFKRCARARTKSLRELFQFLIVLSFFNRYKGATAYPILNAGMLQL